MGGMEQSPIEKALADLVGAHHAFRIEEDRLAAELAEARRIRDSWIVYAFRAGVRQHRIAEVTGYSREMIRQVVRDAPPAGEPSTEGDLTEVGG